MRRNKEGVCETCSGPLQPWEDNYCFGCVKAAEPVEPTTVELATPIKVWLEDMIALADGASRMSVLPAYPDILYIDGQARRVGKDAAFIAAARTNAPKLAQALKLVVGFFERNSDVEAGDWLEAIAAELGVLEATNEQ